MQPLDYPLWYYEHYPTPVKQSLALFLGPDGNDDYRSATYLLAKTEEGTKLFVRRNDAPVQLSVNPNLLDSAYQDRFSAAWVRRNFQDELWVAYQTGNVNGYRQEPGEIVVLRNGQVVYEGLGYDPHLVYLAQAFPENRQHLEIAPVVLVHMSNDGRTVVFRDLESGNTLHKVLGGPHQLVRVYPVQGKLHLWLSPEGSGDWLGVQIAVIEPERRWSGPQIYYQGTLVATLPHTPDHVSVVEGPDGIHIAYEYGGKTYWRKPDGRIEGPLRFHSPVLIRYTYAGLPDDWVAPLYQQGRRVFLGVNQVAEIDGYLLEVEGYRNNEVRIRYKTPNGYGTLTLNLTTLPRPNGPSGLRSGTQISLKTKVTRTEATSVGQDLVSSGAVVTESLSLYSVLGEATAFPIATTSLVKLSTAHKSTTLQAFATHLNYNAYANTVRSRLQDAQGTATPATVSASSQLTLKTITPFSQAEGRAVEHSYISSTIAVEQLVASSGEAIPATLSYNIQAILRGAHVTTSSTATTISLTYSSTASPVALSVYGLQATATALTNTYTPSLTLLTRLPGTSLGAQVYDFAYSGAKGNVSLGIVSGEGSAQAKTDSVSVNLALTTNTGYSAISASTLHLAYTTGTFTFSQQVLDITGSSVSSTLTQSAKAAELKTEVSSSALTAQVFQAEYGKVILVPETAFILPTQEQMLDNGMLLAWQPGGYRYVAYSLTPKAEAVLTLFNTAGEGVADTQAYPDISLLLSGKTVYTACTATSFAAVYAPVSITSALTLLETSGTAHAQTSTYTSTIAISTAHSGTTATYTVANYAYTSAGNLFKLTVYNVAGTAIAQDSSYSSSVAASIAIGGVSSAAVASSYTYTSTGNPFKLEVSTIDGTATAATQSYSSALTLRQGTSFTQASAQTLSLSYTPASHKVAVQVYATSGTARATDNFYTASTSYMLSVQTITGSATPISYTYSSASGITQLTVYAVDGSALAATQNYDTSFGISQRTTSSQASTTTQNLSYSTASATSKFQIAATTGSSQSNTSSYQPAWWGITSKVSGSSLEASPLKLEYGTIKLVPVTEFLSPLQTYIPDEGMLLPWQARDYAFIYYSLAPKAEVSLAVYQLSGSSQSNTASYQSSELSIRAGVSSTAGQTQTLSITYSGAFGTKALSLSATSGNAAAVTQSYAAGLTILQSTTSSQLQASGLALTYTPASVTSYLQLVGVTGSSSPAQSQSYTTSQTGLKTIHGGTSATASTLQISYSPLQTILKLSIAYLTGVLSGGTTTTTSYTSKAATIKTAHSFTQCTVT